VLPHICHIDDNTIRAKYHVNIYRLRFMRPRAATCSLGVDMNLWGSLWCGRSYNKSACRIFTFSMS